jgi:hypothetical protein
MQTLSSQSPRGISQQSRKIAVFAVLLFALSGLISGFAVGAFVRPRIGSGTTSTGSGTPSGAQSTKTSQSTTAEHINLDFPVIGDFSYSEVANGSTSYIFTAQILDKSKNPIQASDVMCKLWLTKNGNVNTVLKADNAAIPRAIDQIQQPFPHEVANGLNFISPSQQVQRCTANGKTTWSYTISPSVGPGIYYLVVLADWKGKSYTWSWQSIKIKKAD